jgi:hypothetical protein
MHSYAKVTDRSGELRQGATFPTKSIGPTAEENEDQQ